MTELLDRVPVAAITRQAREVKPLHVLLAVLAGVLFGIGWLAAKAVGAIWFGLVWVAVAIREGWRDARTPAALKGAIK